MTRNDRNPFALRLPLTAWLRPGAVAAFVLLFSAAGQVAAQDNAAGPGDASAETAPETQPETDDVLDEQSSPDVEPTRSPRRSEVEARVGAPAPQVDVDPAVVGVPPGQPEPQLRREGEFVVNEPGRVIRPEGASEWFFVPNGPGNDQARDQSGSQLPPMVLQPSGRLEMIEAFLQDQDDDQQGSRLEGAFEVSGRVHTYRGVNYLLLTQARPDTTEQSTDAASPDAPADEQATDTPDDGDRSPADTTDPVLEELLAARQPAPSAVGSTTPDTGSSRSSDGTDAVAGSAPDASAGQAREEGSMVVQRRGRVTRSRDGAHVMFTFAADSEDAPETPMILQPGRLLQEMENIVRQRGDQVEFVVSGQVYTYHGANHLLPTLMRVAHDRGNLEN